MMRPQMLMIVVLAGSSLGYAHGPCWRAFTDTPIHERIFLPKSLVKQPTVADLTTAPVIGDTNVLGRLFDDPSKERAGQAGRSPASEVPLARLTVHCAGGLLNARNITKLLECTVIVPRELWLEHQSSSGRTGRYVLTLSDPTGEKFTVDLREGGCALVFFPDATYRCIMDRGYPCVQPLQPTASPNAAPPHR